MTNTRSFADRLAAYALDGESGEFDPTPITDYAEAEAEGDFVIPEDLAALSDEDLSALHEQAVSHFDGLYGDGSGLTSEDVAALGTLTEGIETIMAELASRETARAERQAIAADLAARIHPGGSEASGAEPAPEAEADPQPQAQPISAQTPTQTPEPVAASGARREFRVSTRPGRGRSLPAHANEAPTRMEDLVLAADVPGFTPGQGLSWRDLGRAVDRRLTGHNASQYMAANRAGRHLREQYGVAVFRKPFDPSLVLTSSDPAHVEEVIQRAIDERRLPGGSLVASGGWGAPSETLYRLTELESRDGLFSLPEVGIARGGINYTPGPTFSDIYSGAPGWLYTEAQDTAGTYAVDANGVGTGGAGTKPVYTLGSASFTEARLQLDGVQVNAGLLKQRGFPELIARAVRGVLVAHDHRMAGRVVAAVVAGSTAVTMPDRAGALSPLLDAIELQVEHTRYIHRLSRGTTLEAVFPFWVLGLVRSDLSRRTGVDMLAVTNAQIVGWFAQRGIAPQFIYNWQDLTGAAGSFLAWPESVKFLLYPAGTWIRGATDVITLDTIYDSTLLGNNDFTALFTEEGWLTAKVGHDSRVVTVPVCANGVTSAALALDCDGQWFGTEGS